MDNQFDKLLSAHVNVLNVHRMSQEARLDFLEWILQQFMWKSKSDSICLEEMRSCHEHGHITWLHCFPDSLEVEATSSDVQLSCCVDRCFDDRNEVSVLWCEICQAFVPIRQRSFTFGRHLPDLFVIKVLQHEECGVLRIDETLDRVERFVSREAQEGLSPIFELRAVFVKVHGGAPHVTHFDDVVCLFKLRDVWRIVAPHETTKQYDDQITVQANIKRLQSYWHADLETIAMRNASIHLVVYERSKSKPVHRGSALSKHLKNAILAGNDILDERPFEQSVI